MVNLFYEMSKLYSRFCNPYNQNYYDRKKQDDDFKAKNHQKVLDLVKDHPLEVLRNMSIQEIDHLAHKFSILLKGSFYSYPISKDYVKEIVIKFISKSDYPLARRFRTSFKNNVKDLYYCKFRDNYETNGYLMLNHVYDDIGLK